MRTALWKTIIVEPLTDVEHRSRKTLNMQ